MSNNESGRERERWYEKPVRPKKCDVRLTAEEDNMLDQLAYRNEVSRSDVMRRALRDFARFNNTDNEE